MGRDTAVTLVCAGTAVTEIGILGAWTQSKEEESSLSNAGILRLGDGEQSAIGRMLELISWKERKQKANQQVDALGHHADGGPGRGPTVPQISLTSERREVSVSAAKAKSLARKEGILNTQGAGENVPRTSTSAFS